MKNICILFGGVSPEHEVSLRSAQSILCCIDKEKYNILPVGITRDGQWVLYGGTDYSTLPDSSWESDLRNLKAVISPMRGQGLIIFSPEGMRVIQIDCVFPVLHGANGEDGSIQGLMQVADIPCVGSGVGASAAAMDKTLTKLIADKQGILQAKWRAYSKQTIDRKPQQTVKEIELTFEYPVFIKPAETGSSVGVSKAWSEAEVEKGLALAAKYGEKVIVEEFIDGQEIEVAVLGNTEPAASECGEIVPGADFYDYEAKYLSDDAQYFIPANITDAQSEQIRDEAVKIYKAIGCRGLSRVDFFVRKNDGAVVFNEINTIPGFTSISMYPKLMEASGIEYPILIVKLIEFAMEESGRK